MVLIITQHLILDFYILLTQIITLYVVCPLFVRKYAKMVVDVLDLIYVRALKAGKASIVLFQFVQPPVVII